MLRNKFNGNPGGGATDVRALGGNMRRKTLVISFSGSGVLLVSLGHQSATGTDADFTMVQNAGPLILTEEMVGDSIHDEVYVWNSAASGPCSVMEFFTN